jgi:hypothetical protein
VYTLAPIVHLVRRPFWWANLRGSPQPPRGGALQDELGAQAPELAQLVRTADPIEQDLLDGFLDPGARGYPSFHGVVSTATSKVCIGAYAVFTFTAGSGRQLAG